MASSAIMGGPFCPVGFDDKLTIPQFMVKYNPDLCPTDKVVHIDTIANKSLTYGGLREQAARCAWGLRRKMGVKEGDIVMAIVPNSTDFIILAHATLWIGAVFSPLNPGSVTKDIAHAVDLVRPSHLAIHPSKLEAVELALTQLGLAGPTKPHLFTVIERSGGLSLFPDDIVSTSKDDILLPYDLGGKSTKDVAAFIIFSSGTTGKIKGVQLSHYNIISNMIQSRISVPGLMNSSSRECFFPPYCHIYGLSVVVLHGMWVGSFTCGIPAFEFELFCQKMAQYKATWAHIVPPIAVQLANSDVALKYDLSALKTILIAAAPTKRALQVKLKTRFGQDTRVVQGFGMSECSPTVTLQTPLDDENNIGTVGKVIAGTEVRLVDPVTLKDVARGEEGELWVRGPQTMMGYYNNEAATRETYVGDWLRTGDIMRVDENDNFWITDRLKELIKYKGFQVPPSELEDLLLQHPSVVDAAVTSIYSDEQATELPIAYVTLHPRHNDTLSSSSSSSSSSSPSSQPSTQSSSSTTRSDSKDNAPPPQPPRQKLLSEIRAWVDGQVAGYKKLRGGVWELAVLPKTPSGKILRKDLPCRRVEARAGLAAGAAAAAGHGGGGVGGGAAPRL